MATLHTAVTSELHGCNPEQLLGNVHLAADAGSKRADSENFHRAAYQIGGISFGMFSDGDVLLALDSALHEFAVPAVAPKNCDVNIHVSLVDQLPTPQRKPLFHSGGLWSLFEERRGQQDGYRLNFQRSFPVKRPTNRCGSTAISQPAISSSRGSSSRRIAPSIRSNIRSTKC